MNRWMKVCATAVLLAGACSVAMAKQPWVVEFRLEKWQTMHFASDNAAARHLTVVKKLGCEAEKHQHNGHYDVRYRCPNWKQMTLATDDEAHQWVHWLKIVGFETAHEH